MSYGLKSSVVRNHCNYSTSTTPNQLKSSGLSEIGHMPPPIQQITSSSSLMHSPDSHSSGSSSSNVKKESMTINPMNDNQRFVFQLFCSSTIFQLNYSFCSVPSSHYGLVSLQIAAAVKKAQLISEKRCANSSLYTKTHITNSINSHEQQTTSDLVHGKHIENGNNSAATITTMSTNDDYVRRYSDDYYVKDDMASGSHLHLQQPQATDFSRKSDKEQQKQMRTNPSGSIYDKSPPLMVNETKPINLFATEFNVFIFINKKRCSSNRIKCQMICN